jgi:UDP-2,3-diacylglucosamine pyrophosphatase LpxH
MVISDTHLGTKYARAKRLCQMLEHTAVKTLHLNGDIVDGEILLEKTKSGMPDWHRQVFGHFFRKHKNGTSITIHPGNHEKGMRGDAYWVNGQYKQYPSLVGWSVFGIPVAEEKDYVDPVGRRFLILHGDRFDDQVFKDQQSKEFWYHLGSVLNDRIYKTESFLRENPVTGPIAEHFSLASFFKKAVKVVINRKMGVRDAIARELDAAQYDGIIYGHSHMGGFERTTGHKVLMNSGCSTDHVQALVHDRHGTWALIEWHIEGMDVVEEKGAAYSVRWDDLGLGFFKNAPQRYADRHTDRADRLIAEILKRWPPAQGAAGPRALGPFSGSATPVMGIKPVADTGPSGPV